MTAGSTNINDDFPSPQSRWSKKTHIHPKFDITNNVYDFSVIELHEGFDYNDRISFIMMQAQPRECKLQFNS